MVQSARPALLVLVAEDVGLAGEGEAFLVGMDGALAEVAVPPRPPTTVSLPRVVMPPPLLPLILLVDVVVDVAAGAAAVVVVAGAMVRAAEGVDVVRVNPLVGEAAGM